MKKFSLPELASDYNANCAEKYLAINDKVIDITNFSKQHPGSEQAILKLAGADATKEFNSHHSHLTQSAQNFLQQYTIGEIKIKLRTSYFLTLFTFHNCYVSVEKNGKVIGNRKVPKEWEVCAKH